MCPQASPVDDDCHIKNSFEEENKKGALAIRRIFSLVELIKKPKFSDCPNVF